MNKTNAMRILDAAGIDYEMKEYEYDENDLSGVHAAEHSGLSTLEVFKTLVLISNTRDYFVFCIPVEGELDLKKAAKIAEVKKLEMIHVKELLGITGYIRGGCSPIGMKKQFKTYIDENAILLDNIYISGGKRGVQIKINPEKLNKHLGNTEFYDVLK
ncbi:MAG: Cys-tRNA(Pro) deacylase [Peptostreptococcaceae bacterium]|nr:Cys-tRNA(Pro) deacylase [Peptostreptococcaceae bacterium]